MKQHLFLYGRSKQLTTSTFYKGRGAVFRPGCKTFKKFYSNASIEEDYTNIPKHTASMICGNWSNILTIQVS